MKDYHVRTDCRLCGGELSEPLVEFPDTALANEYPATAEEGLAQDRFPLYLVQCKACDHVQLPVVVDPKRLFTKDYAYSSSTSPVMREHLDKLASKLAELWPGSGMPVLEIGSNDGTLVLALRARGCNAMGIDPCCTPGTGLPLFFSLDIARCLQRVECVVALNVFAHADNLDDIANGVCEVLHEGACFVFEVGYLPDVLDRGLFDVVYHEHLSYHHLRPLVPFLESHGLHVYDAERVDTQGGSIRVWALKDREARMSERLLTLLDGESGGMRLSPLRIKPSAAGESLREPQTGCGAAFGAPAKLTTFCAATGWRPVVVYDDNPRKVGRFMPGTSIQIVPSRRIIEDHPDSVVVTAWNFFDEIRARLREWGYRGDIIRPLPTMEVDRA